MSILLVTQPIFDWEESTQRFDELDRLLRECQGIPNDHPLVKEYKLLKSMLEKPAVTH